MLKVLESEIQLTEERLQLAERKVGYSFPGEYRNFLLAHNGGCPDPARFNLANKCGSYSDSCIAWFYAVYDGEYENLEERYEVAKELSPKLPVGMMAIARDPGGNEIFLSLVGKGFGEVYFVDHETGELSLIARSFTEFLGLLH